MSQRLMPVSIGGIGLSSPSKSFERHAFAETGGLKLKEHAELKEVESMGGLIQKNADASKMPEEGRRDLLEGLIVNLIRKIGLHP